MRLKCPKCGREVKYRGRWRARHKDTAGEWCSGGGRPAGSGASSQHQVDTARENGEKGGRPRNHRYYEIFAAMPDPSELDDPLQIASWLVKANAIAVYETMCGRGWKEGNAELQRASKTIAALIPRERLAKAESAIRGEMSRATGKRNRPAGGTLTKAPTSSRPVR